ncbi:MAG: UbiA family prenyltransferase [Xanthobacteraceae bacterium]|jgi:1,4-dihydroxy-2-naphthoate octaprenyltransferase
MTEPAAPSRRDIWVNLLLYPGHTLPTAAAPVIVAVGLAVHDHVFAPAPLLLAFLASWLIHIGGVFTDNYMLLSRHPDVPEHPELLAGLNNGTLTLRGLKAAIIACFVLAVLPGPYLLHVAGFPVVVLGAIGIAASLGYSLSPYSMTKLGIADPLFFVMFGVVAVAGAYYVQAAPAHGASAASLLVPQALPFGAFVLGLPAGALVTNVLLIDDMRDRSFDALKGWRTGPVRFGLNWTRWEFFALTVFSYVVPFWFWLGLGFSPWVLLTLLTLPEAIAVTRVICTFDQLEKLGPMTPRAARLALIHSVLLGIGIAMSV